VRAEQLFIFEAMERGIEGSLLDLECVARDLMDSLRDGIAVNGSKRNDPHDEKVERTLRKVKPVLCFLHTLTFYIYTARCRRSKCIRRVNAQRPALCKTDSEIGLSCDNEGQIAH
jgi:hypothetical protein